MSNLPPDITEQNILKIFELQKKYASILKKSTVSQRLAKLKALKQNILKYRTEIHEALYKDFKKSASETDLGELAIILSSITHISQHLHNWVAPKYVNTPLNLLGTSSYVMYEPKGVALIISPWNYPFQLAIDPLLYAVASGCTVIIKPSEVTPNTSALIKKIIEETFTVSEVAVFEGDAQVAQSLLKLPFDHIFFTGSPQLGKIIAKSASEHLTSTTLELGGKSPAVIDSETDIKDAVQKIVWGKFFNCGQTCIAPDYLLVQNNIKNEFLENLKIEIQQQYPDYSPDYSRIVNKRHFSRIKNLLDDALAKGAKVYSGGKLDENDNFISPTVLIDVDNTMEIMHEEIFGALLPVIFYENWQEATDFINEKPKPLALYIFSQNRNFQQNILQNTSAGGTAINETLAHISHPDLPFGGVNNSGIGKTHGYYGFLAFSNERGVLHQKTGFTTLKTLYPPYTPLKKQVIDWFLKFL